MRRDVLAVAVGVALTIPTFLLRDPLARYAPDGPERLASPSLRGDLGSWVSGSTVPGAVTADGDGAKLALTCAGRAEPCWTQIDQTFDVGDEPVLVQADVETTGDVDAVLAFLERDPDSDHLRWDLPFEVDRELGTSPWTRVGRAFAPSGGRVTLLFEAVGDEGVARIRDVSVRRAVVRPLPQAAWIGLFAGWSALWVAVLVPSLKRLGERSQRRLVAAAAVASVALMMPGNTRDWLAHEIHHVWPSPTAAAAPPPVVPEAPPVLPSTPAPVAAPTVLGSVRAELWTVFRPLYDAMCDLDNVGHLTLFTLLALTSRLAFPKTSAGGIAVRLLLVALGTEVFQMFTVDRSTSLGDVAFDAIGITLGSILAGISLRRAPTPWAAGSPGPSSVAGTAPPSSR